MSRYAKADLVYLSMVIVALSLLALSERFKRAEGQVVVLGAILGAAGFAASSWWPCGGPPASAHTAVAGRGDVAIVPADQEGARSAAPARDTPLLPVAMHQPPGESALRPARRLTTGTQLFGVVNQNS